jgi:hypothetical protein
VSRDPLRGRPAVFARLRADEERRMAARTPARWVPWLGWAISLALVVMVVVLALQASH